MRQGLSPGLLCDPEVLHHRSLLPFNNKTRRTRPRVSVVHIPPVSGEPGVLHSHSRNKDPAVCCSPAASLTISRHDAIGLSSGVYTSVLMGSVAG